MSTVNVSNYKRAVLVTGNTKEYKDSIKQIGGKWNPSLSGWIFPKSRENDVMELLNALDNVIITNRPFSPSSNVTTAERPAISESKSSIEPLAAVHPVLDVETNRRRLSKYHYREIPSSSGYACTVLMSCVLLWAGLVGWFAMTVDN